MRKPCLPLPCGNDDQAQDREEDQSKCSVVFGRGSNLLQHESALVGVLTNKLLSSLSKNLTIDAACAEHLTPSPKGEVELSD